MDMYKILICLTCNAGGPESGPSGGKEDPPVWIEVEGY